MRIAYVTEVDLSIDNGPGINEREFVRAFLDVSPDSVCIVPEPRFPDNYNDGRLCYVPARGRSRFDGHFRFVRGAIDRLQQQQAQGGLHGVGARIGLLPMLPILVKRMLKLPVFLKTVAGYGLMGADAELRFRVIAPVLRRLYGSAIQASVAADTVSIAYVDWLSHTFGVSPSHFALIPNGANTELFCPGEKMVARERFGLDRFSHLVGYVGALHGWRDLISLVEAYAAAQLPKDTGLVLVGSGPSRLQIEARIAALGIQDRVVLTGQVPYASVPSLMQAFDVAVDLTVIPMQVGDRTSLGSFSQKIPQYLAAGVPVIAWSVPDTAFLEEERVGLTATYGDRTGLSRALEWMLRVPSDEAAGYTRRARTYAQRAFSARALAERRIKLWRAAITEDRAA